MRIGSYARNDRNDQISVNVLLENVARQDVWESVNMRKDPDVDSEDEDLQEASGRGRFARTLAEVRYKL